MITHPHLQHTDFVRNAALDGVRGIAIAMVLIWHYFNNQLIPEPNTVLGYLHLATKLCWSGVDLFFVLSGFLIGRILLNTREQTTRVYYHRFYVRRFFRIMPIYMMLLITVYGYSLITTGINQTHVTLNEWVPYLLFFQNYFHETFPVAPLLGITWSLAVEEQFYVLLPFLVRLRLRWFLAVLVTLIVIAPLCRYFTHNYTWIVTRGDSLLIGVLIAYGSFFFNIDKLVNRYMGLIFTAMGMLMLFIVSLSINAPQPGGVWNHLVLGLFYGGIIILVAHGNLLSLNRLLSSSWLVWLGQRSYSIYLVHVLVLYLLVDKFMPDAGYHFLLMTEQGGLIVLGALALTLFISECLYRYIERPMMDLGHHYTLSSTPLLGESK